MWCRRRNVHTQSHKFRIKNQDSCTEWAISLWRAFFARSGATRLATGLQINREIEFDLSLFIYFFVLSWTGHFALKEPFCEIGGTRLPTEPKFNRGDEFGSDLSSKGGECLVEI